MLWIEKMIDKIVENEPDAAEYVCQCGLSTTGLAHFGNYRELIICHAVAEGLKRRGCQTKVVLSFDDYDRYKKVAIGTPKSYQKYIGMPNYSIPSDQDASVGYAQYYEDKVRKNLESMQMSMICVCQHEKNRSGEYLPYVRKALDLKEQIMEINNRYKTKPEEDSQNYYPLTIYCSACHKDFTKILSYDSKNDEMEYVCDCGHHEKNKLLNLGIKCKFKLDWAIRWKHEKVSFEASGKSHMEPMGAFTVTSQIAKEIFGQKAPIGISYEFVTTPGQNGRLSKTAGSIIMMEDAMEMFGRDMILWLLAYPNPEHPVKISLQEGVIDLYKKYENFLASDKPDDVLFREILHITESRDLPSFRQITNELLIWGKSDEELIDYLHLDFSKEKLDKVRRARVYCENSMKDRIYRIRKGERVSFNEEEMKLIESFYKLICNQDYIYGINWRLIFQDNIKTLSKCMNKILFGQEQGPSLKRILDAYPLKCVKEILYEYTKGYHK